MDPKKCEKPDVVQKGYRKNKVKSGNLVQEQRENGGERQTPQRQAGEKILSKLIGRGGRFRGNEVFYEDLGRVRTTA